MCNNINYQILSVQEQELWSLMEVKNYLRVSHENDNKLISNLISASIVYAEQFLGVNFFISKITCLIEQAPSYLRLKPQANSDK